MSRQALVQITRSLLGAFKHLTGIAMRFIQRACIFLVLLSSQSLDRYAGAEPPDAVTAPKAVTQWQYFSVDLQEIAGADKAKIGSNGRVVLSEVASERGSEVYLAKSNSSDRRPDQNHWAKTRRASDLRTSLFRKTTRLSCKRGVAETGVSNSGIPQSHGHRCCF